MIQHTSHTRRGEPTTERPQPDASAGYREEYAHQGVDPDLRPDGGRGYVLPSAGDRVVDVEGGAEDVAIVLDVAEGTTAREAYVEELDATVADLNPEYDALAPVVRAAYLEDLKQQTKIGETYRDVVKDGGRDAVVYSFPAPRLERRRVWGGELST